MSENMASWDVKKMSRVWSQAAEGKSISVNFDHQYVSGKKPIQSFNDM